MVSLFNDDVIAVVREIELPWDHMATVQAADENTRAILNAALAALPREELIEKAARALCDQGINARNGTAATWERHADSFRAMALDTLAAVGLIPEHVTTGGPDQ